MGGLGPSLLRAGPHQDINLPLPVTETRFEAGRAGHVRPDSLLGHLHLGIHVHVHWALSAVKSILGCRRRWEMPLPLAGDGHHNRARRQVQAS